MTTYLICPSVLVSGVWTLDCEEWSEISAPLLWWRGKPSVPRTWCKRWKRESWIRALSTRTCCGSLGSDFEAEWISSLVEYPANRSRPLEVAKPPKTSDTSGPTSKQGLLLSNLESASSRTSMDSQQPSHRDTTRFSTMSSATWKKWVSEQRQDALQRRKSAHRTCGSDGSSLGWSTPNTMDYLPQRSEEALKRQAQTARKGRTRPANLREQVNPSAVEIYAEINRRSRMNWTTPMASEWKNRDTANQISLSSQVNWPTASARDWKDSPGMSKSRPDRPGEARASDQLPRAVFNSGPVDPDNPNTNGNPRGQLNPDWVETLMGFPIGWTDLEHWGTR